MINLIRRTLLVLLLLLPFLLVVPQQGSAQTDVFEQACSAGSSSNSPVCKQKAQQISSGENPVSGVHGAIKAATNVFALVTVVAGLILIAYSAVVFVTAGGSRAGDNSTRARQARSTMVSALVGIAIVALAWSIITYVNTHLIH